MLPTRALSFHAGWRCRHSGVCCSSGWTIPVEAEAEGPLRDALRDGRLSAPAQEDGLLVAEPGLPPGATVRLGRDALGRCLFLEAGAGGQLCRVHRELGEAALPRSCRNFPRVALLAPDSTDLTLSSYCPSAASLLFEPRPDAGDAIAVSPPAFPERDYEGLAARDALSPFLRPGVLMGWAAYRRWEAFCVSELTTRAPEIALGSLARAAERLRGWTPAAGPFDEVLVRALDDAVRVDEPCPAPAAAECEQLFDLAIGACLPGLDSPSWPTGWRRDFERFVAPAWPAFELPIGRYLASRAFASWIALHGPGLRTAVRAVRAAYAVLCIEAARRGASAQRTLESDGLREAIRASDLLLVHLADPEAFARLLAAFEGERLREGASPPPDGGAITSGARQPPDAARRAADVE
jgi:hypothetical protein